MGAIAANFPDFFASLGRLARADRLYVIPGNHDCELYDDAGQAALFAAIGSPLPAARIVPQLELGGRVTVWAHGHEYDPSNRSGLACNGAVITSVLYHAVIPALLANRVPPERVDEIPAIRPEENIVDGIARYLSPSRVNPFLVAFVQLLVDNGYDVSWWWLAKHFVTPRSLRKRLQEDSALDQVLRQRALEVLAGGAPPHGRVSPAPQLFVMGHTHCLDATRTEVGLHYVNLGTWIDGLKEMGGIRDLALPVLKIELGAPGTNAWLYDAREYLTAKSFAQPMWAAY